MPPPAAPSAPASPAETLSGYEVGIDGAGDLTTLLTDNLAISRHAEDKALPREELERLVSITPQQIKDLLATEGYFSPQVTGSLQQRDGRYTAHFDVTLGAPVTIRGVAIGFTGDLAARAKSDTRAADRIARLKSRWELKQGERFRQKAWTDAKNALIKGLLNRDYPAARIADSMARIDPQTRAADLSVDVDSGPAFTFGPLQVNGLKRYPPRLVTGVNPIHPGDPYTQEKLNELQARLQDSGYFRSAFATVDVDPAHPEQVPVRVDVVENPRKRLSTGIGFSTDAGPRLQLKYLDRQFLGRDLRLESDAKVDNETRSVGADLYLPPLAWPLLRNWTPSVGAHLERTDISNVVNNKIRSSFMLTSPDRVNQRAFGVAYFADRQTIDDLPANNREALVGLASVTRRQLDSLVNPRRGYIASLEVDAGPRGLINAQNLVRARARVNWIQPLVRRWHSVVRAEVGQVFMADRQNVPEDLLFRTGGDQSVRGYGYQTLGVSDNGAIVGGRVLAVASAELVYQVKPQWGLAVFHDVGNAADTWKDFRFVAGTGVGVRWRSPVGPVNIDLAFAHETRKPRLHFSIGYGF